MATKKTVDKWKKKKWFELIAPKIFGEKTIGESPAEKPALVVGRTVIVPIDELTGQRKLRHIAAKFRVKEVRESKAFTEIIGFEVNNSYIKRMARRRISKIESIIKGTTKDAKKLRITAIAISSRRLEKRKEKMVRKIIKETIEMEIPQKNFEQLIQEMVFGIITSKILKKAKKIDMLKRVEITKLRVMEGK